MVDLNILSNVELVVCYDSDFIFLDKIFFGWWMWHNKNK